jgi:hypothetical protein
MVYLVSLFFVIFANAAVLNPQWPIKAIQSTLNNGSFYGISARAPPHAKFGVSCYTDVNDAKNTFAFLCDFRYVEWKGLCPAETYGSSDGKPCNYVAICKAVCDLNCKGDVCSLEKLKCYEENWGDACDRVRGWGVVG